VPPVNEEVPLPPSALARLAGSATVFTSGLSVNEMAMLSECGLAPVGLAIGTAMQHIGVHPQRWAQSVELGMLTEAMRSGRELALKRMEAEADALDAEGVVGVRLQLVGHEGAGDVVEFLATGTAVAAMATASFRTGAGQPFTTELSGQDLWTLLRTGHAPVAVVAGVCVYHVAHQAMRQAMAPHVELAPYSQALYDARELAVTRMQASATSLGAGGVVGVRIEDSARVWGPHAIEVTAVGTAVRSHPVDAPLPTPARTLPVAP
jgi:uncharacterized protein YbjQ (UPF0145 family)